MAAAAPSGDVPDDGWTAAADGLEPVRKGDSEDWLVGIVGWPTDAGGA